MSLFPATRSRTSPSANAPEQDRGVSTSTASVGSSSVGPSTSLAEPNTGIVFFPASTGRQEQASPVKPRTAVNTAAEAKDETAMAVTVAAAPQKADKPRNRFRNEPQKSFAEERDSFDGVDVSSDSGADSALVAIEFMIQNAIDSAASFGSAQGRIETQANFINSLTDSLKSGIGTLVDANMEDASAKLQALQVQQQLGVQALSIANQAPQSLLSLFR